ncbi:MAG: hypothetical protein ABR991_02270 [Terracidiphilus sp.]|jgi:hypothetical protein
MHTAIEFPESLFRQGEQVARLQGVTVEEFAIRALERELSAASGSRSGQTPVKLPLVPSKSPGVLDLKDFDFDDLLA